MSFESLTSFEARQALNELKTSDPVFYAEITSGQAASEPVGIDGEFPEDDEEAALERYIEDDSATHLSEAASEVLAAASAAALLDGQDPDDAADSDADIAVPGDEATSLPVDEQEAVAEAVQEGRAAGPSKQEPTRTSKRMRQPTKRYSAAEWVKFDDESSDEC